MGRGPVFSRSVSSTQQVSLWDRLVGALAHPTEASDLNVRRSALASMGAQMAAFMIPSYWLLSWLFSPPSSDVYALSAVGWFGGLVALYLCRQGQSQSASLVLVATMWGAVALLTLNQGVDSGHASGFAPVIVASGLLLPVSGSIAATLLSVVFFAVVYRLQDVGVLAPLSGSFDYSAPVSQFFATGGFVAALVHAFEKALRTLEAQRASLLESEILHSALVSESPNGILVLAVDGTVETANRAAADMLGQTVCDLVSASFTDLPMMKTSAEDLTALANVEADQVGIEVVVDGETRELVCDATPLRYPGLDHKVLLTLRDVTEARILERRREELESRLRRSERMEAFGQLAGGIAHDFNNLLTGMVGHLELIEGYFDDAGVDAEHEARADLRELTSCVNRATAVTRQLLAFSKNDSSNRTSCRVDETIAGLNTMLRRMVPEDIVMEQQLLSGISASVSSSDIEQTVMNLVLNARDAMPDGGRVVIRTEEMILSEGWNTPQFDLEAGCYCVIEVKDSGIGMDEHTVARAFEPFFTTKPSGSGTGLGLATVHGIVRRAGGAIEVYSREREGSIFCVYLPAALEHHDTEVVDRVPRVIARGHETILVCEDDATILNYTVRVLRRHGYQVLYTDAAATAIQLFEEHPEIALLLTDIIMPEMNGPELAACLRLRRPELLVLFTSGYTGGLLADRGYEEIEWELLPKPYSSATLLSEVRKVLDQARHPVEETPSVRQHRPAVASY